MTRCIYFSSLLEVAHHTIHKVAATYISPPLSFMLVPWYMHVFSFLFFSSFLLHHLASSSRLQRMMTKGPLYIHLEHRSDSCAIKPSIWSNFINYSRPNLLTCKVMRSDYRSWYPCGEIVVKRINLLWTNGRDVHYPMVSPIRPMLRGGAEEKFVPISSSRPNGLAPKLCHLRRHMGWVIVRANPYYESPCVGFDETERSYWAQVRVVGLALNPAPSIKWP